MRTLTIDTSVNANVALVEDGDILAEGEDLNPRHHAEGLGELLSGVVRDAGFSSLKEAGIEEIVVGVGPAPYTALRAGMAFGAALGKGLGVPVLGIPSLDGLGLNAGNRKDVAGRSVLVLTDAKRGEVYFAEYRREGDGVTRVSGPSVGTVEEALGGRIDATATPVFFGALPLRLREQLDREAVLILKPSSSELATVARRMVDQGEGSFALEPLYLRRPDVSVPGR